MAMLAKCGNCGDFFSPDDRGCKCGNLPKNEPIVMVDPNAKAKGAVDSVHIAEAPRSAIVAGKKEKVREKAHEFRRHFGTNWDKFVGNDLVKRFFPDVVLFVWALVGSFFVGGLLGKEWSAFFFGFYFAVFTAPPLLFFSEKLADSLGIKNVDW